MSLYASGSVEVHLVHGHDWVKLVSSQLFNELFAACSPEHLVAAAAKLRNKHGGARRKSDGSKDGKIIEKTSNYLAENLSSKVCSMYHRCFLNCLYISS